jgi:hypothetical protein
MQVVREYHPDEEIVFLTTDGDWRQVLIEYPNSKFYNAKCVNKSGKNTKDTLKRSWEELQWQGESPKKEKINLLVKILAGDGKDNIKPCPEMGRATCYTADAARAKINKILLSKKDPWGKLQKYFENPKEVNEAGEEIGSYPDGGCYAPAYFRNRELVVLSEMPEEIYNALWEAFDNSTVNEPDYTWADYGLEQDDLFTVRALAQRLAKGDV